VFWKAGGVTAGKLPVFFGQISAYGDGLSLYTALVLNLTVSNPPMATHLFDDTLINWQTLDGFAHLAYYILNIDEANTTIDVLFKFTAQQQIVLHRHKALNHTFVIQGEHRLYRPDGTLKEVRGLGSYTVSPPSNDPHREGGGTTDTVVFFSIRGSTGVLYEILDDDQQTVASLSMADFISLYQNQPALGTAL
jgi:hypothetical protein